MKLKALPAKQLPPKPLPQKILPLPQKQLPQQGNNNNNERFQPYNKLQQFSYGQKETTTETRPTTVKKPLPMNVPSTFRIADNIQS